MVDVKIITPDDLDNTTVFLNNEHKVQVMATAVRPTEIIDPKDLEWTTYPHDSNLLQAVWKFKTTYKKPFLTQMATATVGLATGQPVVYFYDLKSDQVTIIISSSVLGTLRNGNRFLQVRVEENDTTTLMQASGGTPDADIINQYIAQNLEIVEQVSNFHDGWGNWVDSPFGIRISGQQYMIDRVGRIKGTNWLVFGSSAMT